jgi:hypothetical protein
MSAHEPRVVSIDQHGSTDSEPSAASSKFSLSMMRQAFDGLLANTERSMSSSTDQRGELERPRDGVNRPDRVPNAFAEEAYSFNSVSDSDDGRLTAVPFETSVVQGRPKKFSVVESTQFFDYLLAIGGS